MAAASDRHAARLVFQSASVLIADYARDNCAGNTTGPVQTGQICIAAPGRAGLEWARAFSGVCASPKARIDHEM